MSILGGDLEVTDVDRRDELVRSHLGLAHHLARRFGGRGIPHDDLAQVAALALVLAAGRYDPSRGTSFAGYAAPTIIGEIKRHFRDRAWDVHVPRRVQELHLAVNRLVGPLTQELGRSPTLAELADLAQVTEEEVVEAIEASNAYQAASLDAEPAPGRPGRKAALAAEDGLLDAVERRLLVDELLERLPPRERLIVELRFFSHLTQAAIAARLGISQMHVSRLLTRSLAHLREAAGDGPGGC